MAPPETLKTLFTRLRHDLAGTLLQARVDSSRFDILVAAATAKSIDFNIRIHEAPDTDGILLQPFLRSLVEELIYLVYLQTLSVRDQDDLVHALQARDVFRSVRQQQAFFGEHRPTQPVFLAEFQSSDPTQQELKANRDLKDVWLRLGWQRRGPTVRDLAERVELVEVYDYLYAATSRFVHFSPHAMFRLGWAGVAETDPAVLQGDELFSFSLSHFAKYHAQFTRFYATLLYLFQYEAFKDHYPTLSSIDATLSGIRDRVGDVQRWPEVVTFEEMNIKPRDGVRHFLRIKYPLAAGLLGDLSDTATKPTDN